MWFLLLFINCFFAYMAEKAYDRNKKLCVGYLLLIIFISVFFVGLRDFGVGTDTKYIPIYFDNARSIKDIFLDSDFDKGFMCLAYLAHFWNEDPQVLLILTELFIILFIVLGIYELKKTLSCNIFWFILLFNFLFQEQSINLMRQYCAMAILFYGFSLFLQKRYYIYIVCQIIGYYFHSTSVIFVIIPLCIWVSQMDVYIRYLFTIGLLVFLGGLLFSYYTFLAYFENFGILKESYYDTYGIGSKFISEDGTFSLRAILIYIIEVALCYFLYKDKEVSNNIVYVILILSTINVLLIEMMTVMMYFYRLSYYIGLVLIGYISGLFRKKTIEKYVLLFAYLLCVIQGSFYFYDDDALRALNSVYKSKILGI